MPNPHFDRLAAEGMTFFSFYAHRDCTPGRAAMVTGSNPNRSGMTLWRSRVRAAVCRQRSWTLASVLKQADYRTFFTE